MNYDCNPPSVLLQMIDTKEIFKSDIEQLSNANIIQPLVDGHSATHGRRNDFTQNNVQLSNHSMQRQSTSQTLTSMQTHSQTSTETHASTNSQMANEMKIGIYDHMQFREKFAEEIMNGSSVFSCIPCTNDPTNTLLCDAYVKYTAYSHIFTHTHFRMCINNR